MSALALVSRSSSDWSPRRVAVTGGEVADGPGLLEREREGAALVAPAVVVVRGGHRRRDRGQVRRLLGGGEPLGGADVGEAVHADLAARARQGGGPLDRVVAVLHLVPERVELALRGVGAAHVLDDDDVALGGVVGGRAVDVGLRRGLVVGQAHQDDRVGAVLPRAVDVGQQHGAVAHGGRHVELALHRAGTVRLLVGRQGPGGLRRAERGEADGARQHAPSERGPG